MKDAYYFSHDSNAKDDPKCMLLIDQLGLEGYGIYWVLVEILRDQPGYKYPLKLVPIIARRYNTTPEKMNTVVQNYGLFHVDENNDFFSFSLVGRMKPLEEKREKNRLAGIASGKSRRKEKEHLLNERSASDELSKVNESKVNESKVNESKVEESSNIGRFDEDDFQITLNLYGKKTHLMDARNEWSLLLEDDKIKAIDHIPKFIKNHQDNDKYKFLPRFSEYLRQRRWDEDLPYEQKIFESVLQKIEEKENES